MIVKKEFLNKIKDFGINSYEAKIWTALLSRGVSTAGELSDIANVPRSRSYDVLESLEKKGFVIMKIGKPIKYIAVPPSEVLERVKKNLREEADQTVQMIDQLRGSEILDDLTKLHENGVSLVDPTDMSGAVKGRDNLYDHLQMMIKDAEESVILVTSADGLDRKAEYLIRSLKKAKEKGVKIMISANVNKETEAIKEIRKIAEIKDLKLNGRFCIIDGTSVLFMLTNDVDVHPSYDVGVWINTEFFAQTMTEMFKRTWETIKVKN